MMARKFVDSEEAAKMLGVSVETLNEMRDRHEVFPVRDGGQWKYKFEDVERLVAQRGEDSGLPAEYEDGGSLDSILLSEVELGGSSQSPSSTIIGKMNEPPSPDSDIQIAEDKPKKAPEGKKPLTRLPESPSDLSASSDVR